jgi:hypothetical protein
MKKSIILTALIFISLAAKPETKDNKYLLTRPIICMNETVIAESCSGGTCTQLIRGTTCFEIPETPSGPYTLLPGTHYYTRTSTPVE